MANERNLKCEVHFHVYRLEGVGSEDFYIDNETFRDEKDAIQYLDKTMNRVVHNAMESGEMMSSTDITRNGPLFVQWHGTKEWLFMAIQKCEEDCMKDTTLARP